MKICVLGAGVIGVSTAYALARLGHKVRIIDRASDVAMGASYANGAQLSYSYVDPLASPATFRKLPNYLIGRDKALQLKFKANIDYFRWGASFLWQCSGRNFAFNRAQRQNLSQLSFDALQSFERDMAKSFKPTGHGKLVLIQTRGEYEILKNDTTFISLKQCLEIEPRLQSWGESILGGIYAPGDKALDTITYCQVLKLAAEENFDVTYYFDEVIKSVAKEKHGFKITTDKRVYDADKVIVCLGNEASDILKPFGISLPIYPVRGYSLTLRTKAKPPLLSVTDLKNKMLYANLGDRLRITGFADVNQREKNIENRLALLEALARKNWPDFADYNASIDKWSGCRPMMPSGVPVIGPSQIDGLYLNLGHGSLGYTFAAGSAVKIVEAIGHAKKTSILVERHVNAK